MIKRDQLNQVLILKYFGYHKHLELHSILLSNLKMKQALQDKPFQLPKGSSLVHSKYKVNGKIGNGTYSTVHSISMIKGKKQVIRAVKVEAASIKEPQISTEVSVLKCIKETNPDEVGFAKMYEYGYENEYHYLVMTILGPNLDQLQKLCGGCFSLKTTIIIALQILDRLQVLHNYGFIYGDIKPNNFVVGLGAQSPFVFIIDFGKCKRYKNRATGQHIVYKQNVYFSFDPIFASINTHNHIQCSRRDDIESLLYMIIYMKVGKLPWIRQQNDVKRSKNEINAEQLKKRVTPEMLCHKMPLQIIDLMYYVRSIQFYERPDYDFIRKLFYRCLERQTMDSNIVYDWNKLEEVDFKVYSGDPKIVLKTADKNGQQQHFLDESDHQKEQIEEDDQNSRMIEHI